MAINRHVGDPREPRPGIYCDPEPDVAARALDHAWRFTETFREHADAHPAEREAACLAVQFPSTLIPLRPDDVVAGRAPDITEFLVEFSPQSHNKAGYCFNPDRIEILGRIAGAGYEAMARDLISFWTDACTQAHAYARWEDDLDRFVGTARKREPREPGAGRLINTGGIRLAGLMLDFDTLLQLGIPGLRDRIRDAAERPDPSGGSIRLAAAMDRALDILVDCLAAYRQQALSLLEADCSPTARDDLRRIAASLAAVAERAPATLHEAVQLAWMYGLVSGMRNYSRMDVYLGDFYARDCDRGLLDKEAALRIVMAIWQRIVDANNPADSRICIGGVGRRNPAAADRFALAAMEATRRLRRVVPTLTLRFHRDQDPVLMRTALDVIGEGCLYPMLYNDDINVPAVEREFGVPREDAERYLPLGCGEYTLDHAAIGSPNTVINVVRCVDAALHNGRCPVSGDLIGHPSGPASDFTTFDMLYNAVKNQIRAVAPLLARVHLHEYAAERAETAFVFASMLHDDCIARGASLVDGGARYRGGCVEGFGFTNAGDSLAAIKRVVYDDKRLSLDELVAALDSNFSGQEDVRRMLLEVPKFGNDEPAVDELVADLAEFICHEVMTAGRLAGLDYLIVSSVNPGGILLGANTGASADGRRLGDPFAIGNSPTAGCDVKGITALLNSVTRVSPENGGFITNLKLGPDLFGPQRATLEALLSAYWACGGWQANITVVNARDLEDAMQTPAAYGHIMVRIGGWSARFVDLDATTQREILRRTLYA